jgi:hypothetical protein
MNPLTKNIQANVGAAFTNPAVWQTWYETQTITSKTGSLATLTAAPSTSTTSNPTSDISTIVTATTHSTASVADPAATSPSTTNSLGQDVNANVTGSDQQLFTRTATPNAAFSLMCNPLRELIIVYIAIEAFN